MSDAQRQINWIQQIIDSNKPNFSARIPVVSEDIVEEQTCMDVHREIIHVEADIQTNITRWQDEMSIDMGQVMRLASPLDRIISIFQSFQIPSHNLSSDNVSAFHVETTLKLLQGLLADYEPTLDALCKARETISILENRNIVNQQRIADWTSNTLKNLQWTRTTLTTLHDKANHARAEREILKSRIKTAENARKTSEGMVLSLVERLNRAEELIMSTSIENKRLQKNLMTAKTHLDNVSKLQKHFSGIGIMDDSGLKQNSKARQRAQSYSDSLKIREAIYGSVQSLSQKKKSGKVKSKLFKHSESQSITRPYTYDMNSFDQLSPKPKYKSSTLSPAQNMLLSKLSDVDGEINILAKKLMLNE